jgi:hypothetical protein
LRAKTPASQTRRTIIIVPAKWQRWMPMEIDALKASPAVQAMHPCARSGYVWLLLDAWQTEDCTIPSDPIDLADKSGLGDDLWAIHGLRILRKFDRVDGSDRLRNLPQYERWTAAKAAYEGRRQGANRMNEQRWLPLVNDTVSETVTDTVIDEKHTMTDSVIDHLPSFPPHPLSNPLKPTGTLREREVQKQKPSRSEGAKKVDERHQACKAVIKAYWETYNPELEVPWDGSEGKALGMFLSANSKITDVGVRKLLEQRARSEVNHSERPSKWIRNLISFARGPIDRYGKPLSLGGGTNAPISSGKTDQNMGLCEELIAEDQYRGGPREDGVVPSGEAEQDGPPTLFEHPRTIGHASVSGGDGGSSGKPKGGWPDGLP